jgi:uncharacterized membrane protein YbhN (UPF0104 family)
MAARDDTAPRSKPARALWSVVQLAVTVALLAWAYGRLDFSQLGARALALPWLALALACTAPAFLAAALRWSFTAQRLGVPLSFRRALREVYLASFLNSVLPSGIAGDVLRAARHGARSSLNRGQATRAWLAVVCERCAGQLLLWSLLLVSLAAFMPPALAALGPAPWLFLLAALGFGIWRARSWLARVSAASAGQAGEDSMPAPLARGAERSDLLHALESALLVNGAFVVQLTTSALVLVSCALGFACTAKGLSLPLSLTELVRIVPALLALSALPLSIGGFGVREVASATLYSASGLDAATGVLVASTFGLLNLLGSAPGALYTWLSREVQRDD